MDKSTSLATGNTDLCVNSSDSNARSSTASSSSSRIDKGTSSDKQQEVERVKEPWELLDPPDQGLLPLDQRIKMRIAAQKDPVLKAKIEKLAHDYAQARYRELVYATPDEVLPIVKRPDYGDEACIHCSYSKTSKWYAYCSTRCVESWCRKYGQIVKKCVECNGTLNQPNKRAGVCDKCHSRNSRAKKRARIDGEAMSTCTVVKKVKIEDEADVKMEQE